ncbi:hypothetical protein Dxin01_03949 [Deinococcus xinjiangensis]|uniref:Uncharacterized protein n=1 Tax=Deinococcus xinjiangensis TaxID=457454 RepID=A0ABP9VG29_9DEIO
MNTILYSSEILSQQWPENHPFHPPTPELVGQADEYVALHPIRLERDSVGRVHCHVSAPLIYEDFDVIARNGAQPWLYDFYSPMQSDMPFWALMALESMKFHLGEREMLITALLNEEDEPWVYLVRTMVCTESGYAEMRLDRSYPTMMSAGR